MSEESYEGIRHTSPTGKPTYVMVPRKLLITAGSIALMLFLMVLASFQYTNYVDRRSNSYWCGIAVLFDDTYKQVPPPTETGKILQREFANIRDGYNCR